MLLKSLKMRLRVWVICHPAITGPGGGGAEKGWQWSNISHLFFLKNGTNAVKQYSEFSIHSKFRIELLIIYAELLQLKLQGCSFWSLTVISDTLSNWFPTAVVPSRPQICGLENCEWLTLFISFRSVVKVLPKYLSSPLESEAKTSLNVFIFKKFLRFDCEKENVAV